MSPKPEEANLRVDLELVDRVRAGDSASIDRFMTRIQCVRRFVSFRNLVYGNPLSAEELEDTIQDVYLTAWRRLDTYEGRGQLEAWLYRYSSLVMMSRLRKHRTQPRQLESPEQTVEAGEGQDLGSWDLERMYEALDRLPEGQGLVLKLKYLDQLTFEEVARHLQISVNTVKTRHYRAIRHLQALLRSSRERSQAGGES